MKKTDVCALWGSWPFRRISHNTIEDLKAMHARYGFTGGYISSLESIFYSDPMESEEVLAEALRGTNYRQVVTVNPSLPAFDEMIDEAAERFDIAAVRIVPGYHDYRLTAPCMEKLHAALLRNRLPLYVVRRIEDVRLNHLMIPREFGNDESIALAESMPDVKLLFSGFSPWDAAAIVRSGKPLPNVYFETSLFKVGVGDFPGAIEAIGEDRVLFGSAYPFYVMGTQVMNLEENDLSETTRQKIYSQNAEAFFAK